MGKSDIRYDVSCCFFLGFLLIALGLTSFFAIRENAETDSLALNALFFMSFILIAIGVLSCICGFGGLLILGGSSKNDSENTIIY